MSCKCVVMLRCHHELLHPPSTPPRDVTRSTPRLKDATTESLPSQISRFSMWGIPIGLVFAAGRGDICFCFEFTAGVFGTDK